MKRYALLMLAVSVLAACETPPAGQGKVATPPTVPSPEPPAPPPPPPVPPVVVGPPTPAMLEQAKKASNAAIEALENGNEESARSELKRALDLDPQQKLALMLLKQLNDDPVATLGRESYPYTVKANETLSKIALRVPSLGDVHYFYILARYNDIKVPKLVSSGQVIRLPGKAPPPERASKAPAPASTGGATPVPPPVQTLPSPTPPPPAPPPPSPPPPTPPGEVAMRKGEAFEKAGKLEDARAEYLIAFSHGYPGAAEKAEQMRNKLVSRYTSVARGACAKQDLDNCIANWNRVLILEPNNAAAKFERDRALKLKEDSAK